MHKITEQFVRPIIQINDGDGDGECLLKNKNIK